MEVVDENWVMPLALLLNRIPNARWELELLLHYRGVSPLTTWRKQGTTQARWSWLIKDKIFERQFVLIFSLLKEDGAKVSGKRVKPVLILEDYKSREELYRKLFKKDHNSVEAVYERIVNTKKVRLNYSIKPFLQDLVDILSESPKYIMDSLYSIKGVPMLGEEIYEIYGQPSISAMNEAIESNDIGLIDNKVVIEILGVSKKAMAQRVVRKKLASLVTDNLVN
jgi:hypothetical protein